MSVFLSLRYNTEHPQLKKIKIFNVAHGEEISVQSHLAAGGTVTTRGCSGAELLGLWWLRSRAEVQ